MVAQENLNDFKVKTIKDLEVMAKKIKRKIASLENESGGSTSDIPIIVQSLTMLSSEYRLIKREIMDTISI